MNFTEEFVQTFRNDWLAREQYGKIPQEALDVIIREKLFKIVVPKELGGRMEELPQALKLFEQASWLDGNFGWLMTIGSGGGFFVPFMLPEVAESQFRAPEAVIAGSGCPSGRARKVDKGYRVSGQWKFCSGSTHASLFTANCIVEGDGEGEPEIRSFIFSPDQVQIIRDWYAFGLKLTESHSITVQDVFVPEEMTFSLMERYEMYDAPLYRYPFGQFAETSFAAVTVGIGRHFIEEAKILLARNRTSWEAGLQGRCSAVERVIRDAETLFTRQVERFYREVELSWKKHQGGQNLQDEELKLISSTCKHTAQAALKCADSIFPYLGIGAVMETAPINRIWRDLHTACQHSMLVPFEVK